MPRNRNPQLALAAAVTAVAAGAASACSPGTSAAASTTAGSPAVVASTSAAAGRQAAPPGTPPGAQARWLLSAAPRAPLPTAEISAHFDPAFLAQVPAAKLNAFLTGVKSVRLDAVLLSTSESVVLAVTENGSTQATVTLSVDAKGLISGLVFGKAAASVTPPVPASWAALDQQVKSAAPQAELTVARVSGGSCQTEHSVGGDAAAPLGSAFKLYVLDALAQAVARGQVSWNQRLTVTSPVKSLPSGELQAEPAGTRLTVRQVADDMISSSDNTAANMIMALVGRSAVEAAAKESGMADPGRDIPFLTTRELFTLKLVDWPALAQRYVAASPAQRQALLSRTVDKVPYSTLTAAAQQAWTTPRDIDSIEWFASPTDICSVYASLSALGQRDKTLASTLQINNGGVGLDPGQWPTVWFKGGSEPGVLTLNYLARTSGGQTYVVSVLAQNPTGAISDSATTALLGAVKGAFQLAAR
jgi:hypothetical protein